MFEKLKDLIKNFFKEISSDLKKVNISSIFTDFRLLGLLLLFIGAVIILLFNMNFFSLLKGLFLLLVFYFIFLWKRQ